MNPALVWVVRHVLPWIAYFVTFLIPGRRCHLALLEARNKAWIMSLVTEVETILPPKGVYQPITELVDKCYRMGAFPALWAVEGLGNYYAETFRERKLQSKGMMTDPALAGLPAKSMTMLHAGIGLSFAKRNLEGLSASSPPDRLCEAVRRFVEQCREASRPGYLGAALESLGLVTLILHSRQWPVNWISIWPRWTGRHKRTCGAGPAVPSTSIRGTSSQDGILPGRESACATGWRHMISPSGTSEPASRGQQRSSI